MGIKSPIHIKILNDTRMTLVPQKGRNRTVAVPALYHSARADFRFLVLSLKQIRVIDEVACQSKKV